MKIAKLRGVVCISALFLLCVSSSLVRAETSVLCVRKNIKLKKKRIPFKKLFVSSTTGCPNGFVPVFQERSGNEVAEGLIENDGRGSNIDADFLDGVSSESFALQSNLESVAGVVQDAKSDVGELTSRTASLKNQLEVLRDRTIQERVVTVAEQGGDFQTIEDALASLESPSVVNPYLVKIAPGQYVIGTTLTVQSGVTIRGAGRKRTLLTGSSSGATLFASGLVRMESGAELESLTVVNEPGAQAGVAIMVEDTEQANLTDPSTFFTSIKDCEVLSNAHEASSAYAIVLNGASLQIESSNMSVTSTTGASYGISFVGGLSSRLLAKDLTIVAEGTTSGVALDVLSVGAEARLRQVDLRGSSNAIRDSLGLIAEIFDSALRSDQNGLLAAGGTSKYRIFHTAFQAPDHVISVPPADVVCSFASDADTGVSYPSSCE